MTGETGQQPALAEVLSRAERRLSERLERVLAAGGSSLSEWRVLDCLSRQSGRPMGEIAEFSMLPPPTLTKLVDRMVADNYVYRRVDARDRRRVLVHLAVRGRKKHAALQAAVGREQRDLDALPDVDLPTLAALLTHLERHLQR